MINSRIAVYFLFFVNGMLIGNWAPQIPEFANRLNIDESQMGLMIAIFGIGSLISMPIIGIMVTKFGNAPANKFTSLVATSCLLWLAIAPNILVAAIAIFVFGAFIAGMDVAMNAMAVDVERKIKTPIMSSCHGFWSLGGLAGAVSGGYAIQFLGSTGQALFTFISTLMLVMLAWRQIADNQLTEKRQQTPIRFPKAPLPYLIGIVALFSALPEGAVIDWSAFYLREEIGADALTSSYAFGSFSAAMAFVRFLGDPVRKKLGAVKMVKICSLVAAFGLLLSGLSTTPELIITGFAITGLGLSNLIPIAFSAAGNLPGVAPGISLSLTTTIGYSGVLVAPAILGYMAEFAGFSILFTSLSIPLLAVFFLAPMTSHADYRE
ncbi:MAG: MFS transporter [Hyphomicrobiales bacterium]|nr:MFS transporter [Hyphomicrobiales bacterium]